MLRREIAPTHQARATDCKLPNPQIENPKAFCVGSTAMGLENEMTVLENPTRGKCITQNCFDCIYDKSVAGTNRQQVTLCSVYQCALRPFRPSTKQIIPESVLNYYGITGDERAFYRSPSAAKRGFKEGNPVEEYQHKAAA